MRQVLIFIFFLPLQLRAQNLLVNGGFEDENICTEYHKNCAPEAWICSSYAHDSYFINASLAEEGKHYMAVDPGYARWMNDRTYIRSQLLCRLRKNHQYRIEFYIKSKYSLGDSAGIYFTKEDFLFNKEPPTSLIPSAYVSDATIKPVKDDTSWQKITLIYKASGEECFITFGCFSLEHTARKLSAYRYPSRTLVLIDQVSMFPVDPSERLCKDWEKTKQEIYGFDMRHGYLESYIESHIDDIPPPPQISTTYQPKIDTLIIPDILFETSRSALTSKSRFYLDSISKKINPINIDSLVIEGHTDDAGTTEKNYTLSNERAKSVASFFQKKFTNINLITRGWGSDKPIADNKTPAGKAKNRRVEIYLYLKEAAGR